MAGVASSAWPAMVKTAGRWLSTISSRAAPPATWRVTTKGARPEKEMTLAAIATPARAPTWAISSMPRSVPAAITTTERAASRTVRIAEAQPAPEYAATSSPPTRCTVRTPYAASSLWRSSDSSLKTTASTGTPPPSADEVAGEGDRLERDLGSGAVEVGLDVDEDHRDSTPSCSKRSTTAGAASAPSPRICTLLGRRRRQQQLDPLRAARLGGGRALLDLDLLGLHPALHARVARLDAALADRDDGRQRHPVGLLPLRPLADGDSDLRSVRGVLDRDRAWRR